MLFHTQSAILLEKLTYKILSWDDADTATCLLYTEHDILPYMKFSIILLIKP